MSEAIPPDGEQRAVCCFCGVATVDGIDGVRLALSVGGPPTRMLMWAHVTCLSSRVTREFADYIAMALDSRP